MIFEQKISEVFESFIQQCGSIKTIDVDTVRDMSKASINYCTASKIDRDKIPRNQLNVLHDRWYESLSNKKPDWSVYDEDAYLGDLWACWAIYSRNYLKKIHTTNVLSGAGEIKKIVDLGCGFAYTTVGLRQIYPRATVIGTNLDNTVQMDLAKQMADKYDFDMVSSIRDIEAPIDLLFASEYFEHIIGPIYHLKDILYRLNPKVLILANAFTTKSIGHFDHYNIDNSAVSGKKVSRLFNAELKNHGYKRMQTKFWNNRPDFWVKN